MPEGLLDGAVSCHYRVFPLLYARESDAVVALLEDIVAPNRVKKIFKKIGQDMMVDEMFKDDFLQPFKSQGVFDFDDVGMIIRGKFMAKPGRQFVLRKEIFNRVKKAFTGSGRP